MNRWSPCSMCGGSGKTLSRTELETGGRMLRCPKCLGRTRTFRLRLRPRPRPEPEDPPRRLDPKFKQVLESLDLQLDQGEPSPSLEGPKPREGHSGQTSNPKSSRQSPEDPRGRSRGRRRTAGRIPPRAPTNRGASRGWHPPRPSWTFLILVVILCAAMLAGVLFAIEPQLRNELSEWVGRQLNPTETRPPETPVPVAVVVEAPTVEPTATPTPRADSVATIVAMTLMTLPTNTPEPSATPQPTVAPTVIPTPTSYRIDDVEVRMISQERATVSEWHVAVTNLSGDPASIVPIRLALNGGEVEDFAFVSGLDRNESQTFVFDRQFAPGQHSVILSVGDASRLVNLDVPTSTLTPAPPATQAPTPTSTPTSTPIPPTNTPRPTPTVAPPPTASTEVAPHLKHLEHKQYMLELINAERVKAGLNELELGTNNAAQKKADAALVGCHGSHFELNGMLPLMRYHLEGGYQYMGENAAGGNWCLTSADGYSPIGDTSALISQLISLTMNSPGHRSNLLYKWHKKVNIGLARDTYNSVTYQQFEGDYVEYDQLPTLKDGILSFSGRAKDPVNFKQESDLNVSLHWHQPPRPLTVGQVSSVYSYGTETHIAQFRWPIGPGWNYSEHRFSYTYGFSLDPYDLPADAPRARPDRDVAKEWRRKHGYELYIDRRVTAPWITAQKWVAKGETFSFKADISNLLSKHGPGVYRVTISGPISDDESNEISSYSFFHGIDPPTEADN